MSTLGKKLKYRNYEEMKKNHSKPMPNGFSEKLSQLKTGNKNWQVRWNRFIY